MRPDSHKLVYNYDKIHFENSSDVEMIGSTPISNWKFFYLRPLECEINTPGFENSHSVYHGIEFSTLNSSPLMVTFDEKAFEYHLNDATLHLKDDFSYSSATFGASYTVLYDFSSCLRLDRMIAHGLKF